MRVRQWKILRALRALSIRVEIVRRQGVRQEIDRCNGRPVIIRHFGVRSRTRGYALRSGRPPVRRVIQS